MDRLIFSAVLILAASTAVAEDLSDILNRCRAIADEAERLTCFDQASQPVASEPEAAAPAVVEPAPVETAPAVSTTPAASESPAAAADPAPAETKTAPTIVSAVTTEEEFGLERKREKEGIQKITSRYDGKFTGWDGDTLFPLQNGQVWKQIEGGRYSYKADQPIIEIKRGLFLSYYLKVQGQNRTVRVTRIR